MRNFQKSKVYPQVRDVQPLGGPLRRLGLFPHRPAPAVPALRTRHGLPEAGTDINVIIDVNFLLVTTLEGLTVTVC